MIDLRNPFCKSSHLLWKSKDVALTVGFENSSCITKEKPTNIRMGKIKTKNGDTEEANFFIVFIFDDDQISLAQIAS